MAVGKGSIQRAAKVAETAKKTVEVEKKPTTRKPAAKKAPAKKAPEKTVQEVKTIGIGTELPTYLL